MSCLNERRRMQIDFKIDCNVEVLNFYKKGICNEEVLAIYKKEFFGVFYLFIKRISYRVEVLHLYKKEFVICNVEVLNFYKKEVSSHYKKDKKVVMKFPYSIKRKCIYNPFK
jgi:hypothetical protein